MRFPWNRKRKASLDCQIIRKMREILGPNGEHWTQLELEDDQGNYCLLGAYMEAEKRLGTQYKDNYVIPTLHGTIAKQFKYHGSLTHWNDSYLRTWADVDSVMASAESAAC